MKNTLETAEALCAVLSSAFAASYDFAIKATALPCGVTVYTASFTGYCDKVYISESLLKPLFLASDPSMLPAVLCASKLLPVSGVEKAKEALLGGCAVLFFDGEAGSDCASGASVLSIYAADAKAGISRGIGEPNGEVVIRGPREGFVESAETNVALLRKRLKTERLRVEKAAAGRLSQTDLYLVYLDGVASPETVRCVKARLSKLDLPAVMDSGYAEQVLGDCRYPLFPDVGNSEKPDKVASKLVGGRVAVICDGSPCVLTLPYLFIESLQSSEDYMKSPYYATFLRILRLCGAFFAVFLPGIYIALLEFDTAAIPHTLYRTILEARRGIPFTAFTEICVILFAFEIIREVGVRMPRAVGDAVSIVAGIILGDAAIKAGIASAPVIMVAAFSAVCSFIDPPVMNALPLMRIVCLVFSRIFGLFGTALFLFLLAAVLSGKTSCGKPYLLPFAPLKPRGLLDGILAVPDLALQATEHETETEPEHETGDFGCRKILKRKTEKRR